MRWCKALLCALFLAGLLGCPQEFGKGGTIDQAVERDMEEWVKSGRCPAPARVVEICGTNDECLKKCPH